MALNTVSSDRLATNVKNTNFTSAEKQDLTDDILPLAGQLGNRNLIINGAMQVAQRGTSSTSTGYLIDRVEVEYTGLDEAATVAQVDVASGTGPYTSGFRKAYKITNGNQTSGAGAGDRFQSFIKLEAQDIANSGWDYKSTSGKITLSFWFRCSANQTFYAYLRSRDGTSQAYAFSFTASGNNTWTKITHTIPGNSNLTFDNNNDSGLSLYWTPFFGTDYTNNKTLNTWAAYDQNNQVPDMQTTWLTSGAATWDITGIQLEVGDTATSFEHKRFSDELRDCQRYFQKSYNYDDAVGSSGVQGWFQWRRDGGNRPHIPMMTSMRSTPTFLAYNYVGGTSGQFRNASNGTNHAQGSVNVIAQNIVSFDGGATGWNQIGTGEVGFMYYSLESEL